MKRGLSAACPSVTSKDNGRQRRSAATWTCRPGRYAIGQPGGFQAAPGSSIPLSAAAACVFRPRVPPLVRPRRPSPRRPAPHPVWPCGRVLVGAGHRGVHADQRQAQLPPLCRLGDHSVHQLLEDAREPAVEVCQAPCSADMPRHGLPVRNRQTAPSNCCHNSAGYGPNQPVGREQPDQLPLLFREFRTPPAAVLPARARQPRSRIPYLEPNQGQAHFERPQQPHAHVPLLSSTSRGPNTSTVLPPPQRPPPRRRSQRTRRPAGEGPRSHPVEDDVPRQAACRARRPRRFCGLPPDSRSR